MRRPAAKGSGPVLIGNMGGIGTEPLPTLPSSYSVHDFHMYGIHATGITPGKVMHYILHILGNNYRYQYPPTHPLPTSFDF